MNVLSYLPLSRPTLPETRLSVVQVSTTEAENPVQWIKNFYGIHQVQFLWDPPGTIPKDDSVNKSSSNQRR